MLWMQRLRKDVPIIFSILLFFLGCTSLPRHNVRTPSQAFTDTGETPLGRTITALKAGHGEASGFWMLENGLDALVERLELIDNTRRSIDAQYYLFHDDLTGRLLMQHLYRAADRGVRVRLLLDDITLAQGDDTAVLLSGHPNIELRVFNPFSRNISRVAQMIFTADMGRVTRRMHNKTLIADNQVAIIGSRNIGNSYFGADPDLAFQDLDLMTIGPTTGRLSAIFDLFWNSDLTYPITGISHVAADEARTRIHAKTLDDFLAQREGSEFFRLLQNAGAEKTVLPDPARLYWADAEVLFDQPEKILKRSYKLTYCLSPRLSALFQQVQRELIIISPYFVPGNQGVIYLKGLVQRGVRVRVLTNSLASTDVSIVHSGYAKFRKDLLSAGIELYELNKNISRRERKRLGEKRTSMASLHTKAIIFDRREVFVGSLNLDPRAIDFNTEIGVAVPSAPMAEELSHWFDDDLVQKYFRLALKKDAHGVDEVVWYGVVNGRVREFDKEPYSSVWRRLWIGLMSILPLGSHL